MGQDNIIVKIGWENKLDYYTKYLCHSTFVVGNFTSTIHQNSTKLSWSRIFSF